MKAAATLIAVALFALLPNVHDAAAQSKSPASQAYMDEMAKMQKDMPKDPTGDADVDFARMMIPHHQSAVDMSKTLLEHGKDAKLRKMAQAIIKSQTKEIAEFQSWVKAHRSH
jgi:uncharacterized protein (DUF305 family)